MIVRQVAKGLRAFYLFKNDEIKNNSILPHGIFVLGKFFIM